MAGCTSIGEAMVPRISSRGIFAPLPGSLRQGLLSIAPYQLWSIDGIAPGLSCAWGPAFVDVTLPSGPRSDRWQASVGLRLWGQLKLPTMRRSHPEPGALPLLDAASVRLDLWHGDRLAQPRPLLPTRNVPVADRDDLVRRTLPGSHHGGHQWVFGALWGLIELGRLSSREMRFEASRPRGHAPKAPACPWVPDAAAKHHRRHLFAEAWALWLRIWDAMVVGALWAVERLRHIGSTEPAAQRKFASAFAQNLAELHAEGEMAGMLATHQRKRLLVAAPLLSRAPRLPSVARTMLLWPALQLRGDRREEQRIGVSGTRFLSTTEASRAYKSGHMDGHKTLLANRVHLKHTIRDEHDKLSMRTRRLPMMFESQLLGSQLPLQHHFKLDVEILALPDDAEGTHAAVRDVAAMLLQHKALVWRRRLLHSDWQLDDAKRAMTSVDSQLEALLLRGSRGGRVRRLELGYDQVPPRAQTRVESDVWPTRRPGVYSSKVLRGERLLLSDGQPPGWVQSWKKSQIVPVPLGQGLTFASHASCASGLYKLELGLYQMCSAQDRRYADRVSVRWSMTSQALDDEDCRQLDREISQWMPYRGYEPEAFGMPQTRRVGDTVRIELELDAQHLARFAARSQRALGRYPGRQIGWLRFYEVNNPIILTLLERLNGSLDTGLPRVLEHIAKLDPYKAVETMGRLFRLCLPPTDRERKDDSGYYEADLGSSDSDEACSNKRFA